MASLAIAGTFNVHRNTVGQTVAPTPELQAQVDIAVNKMRNIMIRVTTVSMSTTFMWDNLRYRVVFFPNRDA